MKKHSLKKVFIIFLSLLMLFPTMSSSVMAVEEKVDEQTQLLLESAYSQLEAQDALRFYPVIKQHILEKMIVQETRASSVYMPNGGSVYYKNFAGTGTQVTEVYLNKSDSEKYMNGSLSQDAIRILFGVLGGSIPKFGLILSIFLGLQSLSNAIVYRETREGTGCLELYHSEDSDGEASLVLHWSTAYYAYVSSGGVWSAK